MKIKMKTVAIAGLLSIWMTTTALALDSESWTDHITAEFIVTTILQGTSGNDYQDIKDQLDFAFSAEGGLIGEITEGHKVYLWFEMGEGDGANFNVGGRTLPNFDAADTTDDTGVQATVIEAFYEGEFLDGKVTLMAGKMDVHYLNDQNEYAHDEMTQFLNNMFVNMFGVVFTEHLNYFAPTISLTVRPNNLVSLNYNYSKDETEDLFNKGYHVAEVAFHPLFGERSGNYRFKYIVHSDVDFHKINTNSVESNTGFLISLDQQVADEVGLFFRYAAQDDSLVENEVTSAISGGAQIGGGLWGRDNDTVGLAYGKVELNKDLVKEQNEGESVLEGYYNLGINDHIALTGDVQFINDLERTSKRNVFVYGMRLNASF